MSEADKTKVDWELVEKHYRAGLLSLREIAKEAGCTEGAIRKRAKKDGWSRGEKPVAPKEDRSVRLSQMTDELEGRGFVYVVFIHTGSEFFYKIGLATHLDGRIKGHQTSSPFEIRLAIAYFVPNMRAEERTLHALFAHKRVRGEWFQLDREDLELIAKRSLLA